ncbi:cellulase family glycosylhydrolase [Pseudoxanthobacter sp. M-2]|uniref:cellulase family glycosylhydrolase n=1 Tax=Pseudoxanthobacter sp. M-2 TaxID=3078754 RepID=UPI0038FD2126
MGYSITFAVDDRWSTGFVGSMSITNTGDRAANGWTVGFDAPFDITNIWNGTLVSRDDDRYTVSAPDWASRLAPGETVTFGFESAHTGPIGEPAGLTVNGETVVVEDAPPAISVEDALIVDGADGVSVASFTVSLSAPSDETVKVGFATEGGSAILGHDYLSTAGTLTFAPGETEKTVLVTPSAEDLDVLSLTLAGPVGATIADAYAIAAAAGDKAAATGPLATQPTVSIGDASVVERDVVGTTGPVGALSTEGNRIVDEAGNTVKIAGVNWFGLESGRFAPDGLHARNLEDMMDQMGELGFNTIRLPFSQDLFDGAMPSGINYDLNPELRGLTGLEIMDRVIEYAGEIGLKVILDHHRPTAGAGASENGLWYDAKHSEADWIDTWKMLADRYAGDTAVIGADLHNEPHAASWGGGGAKDWAAAAERAGDAIHSVNKDWLIFVEGVANEDGDYYWWGGNLKGVAERPIDLKQDGKVVYSPHDYPNSIYEQPWFSDKDFPDNLTAKFKEFWGYIHEQKIGPVMLGEFGSRLTDPKDIAWFEKITAYLSGDFDADGDRDAGARDPGISWTWWSWNPNSGDTGGILKDDWTSVHENKLEGLKDLMFDWPDGTKPQKSKAEFDVTLSHASDEKVKVDYKIVGETADGDDFVVKTGRVKFAPGETEKTIKVGILGDLKVEGDETFRVVLRAPKNVEIEDGRGIGTIIDNDGRTAIKVQQALEFEL